MRYLLYFLSLLSFVMVGTLIGVPQTNAASPYDEVFRAWPKNNIKTGANQTSNTTEFGYLLATYTGSSSCNNTLRERIVANLDANADYLVTQSLYNYGQPMMARMIIALDTAQITNTVADNWSTSSVTVSRSGTEWAYVYFLNKTNGSDMFQCNIESSSNFTASNNYLSTYWGESTVEFRGFEFQYPSGYDGQTLDPEPPAVETIETAPAWYISNIIDNKGLFHDSNFNTFDGNPFLCEGDLAPVLNYEIFRTNTGIGDLLITSGVQSATAQISYDFGKADSDRDYTIVGWYDCGDGTLFPNQGRADFTINRSGMLVVDLFESCIDENFPFIHVQGCMNNMYTTINLLYFGEITFPTFTFNPACQNLNTMDEWLGLPNNYQVCPQIPSTVRNIVTPFVAFMLGLVTMKFLQRRTGDFNG